MTIKTPERIVASGLDSDVREGSNVPRMPNSLNFLNPSTMPALPGYSQVVEARGGRTIYIAGQVALDAQGALVGANDAGAQAAQALENIRLALQAVGAGFEHVVKLTHYVTDMATALPAYRTVRQTSVRLVPPPASTFVEVRRLFRDEFLIEIDAVAVLPD
jgi:enamine deaminase RidA (YjgF/YER057c/UK114 family)